MTTWLNGLEWLAVLRIGDALFKFVQAEPELLRRKDRRDLERRRDDFA